MMRYAFVAGALLLSAAVNASADSMYCGRELVRAGDPVWQVARKCPDPFWKESYDRPVAADAFGHLIAYDRVEIWTINFGQRRHMRRLQFVNGRLQRIRSLGYGVNYVPGSRRCSPRELTIVGNTLAEIFARCGEPDHRYELPGPGVYGYYGQPAGASQDRRSWTYDFGSRHHPVELLFIDGRLHSFSTQRR